jgi:ribosomal protein L31E
MQKLDKIISLRDATPYKSEKQAAQSIVKQFVSKHNISQPAYDDWQGTIGRTDRK